MKRVNTLCLILTVLAFSNITEMAYSSNGYVEAAIASPTPTPSSPFSLASVQPTPTPVLIVTGHNPTPTPTPTPNCQRPGEYSESGFLLAYRAAGPVENSGPTNDENSSTNSHWYSVAYESSNDACVFNSLTRRVRGVASGGLGYTLARSAMAALWDLSPYTQHAYAARFEGDSPIASEAKGYSFEDHSGLPTHIGVTIGELISISIGWTIHIGGTLIDDGSHSWSPQPGNYRVDNTIMHQPNDPLTENVIGYLGSRVIATAPSSMFHMAAFANVNCLLSAAPYQQGDWVWQIAQ